MSNLPHITGPELIRALQRLGFYVARRKGSHNFLPHVEDPTRVAVVATHNGETIPPGTLTAILRTAKITVEELRKYI
ncbi:HicA toxin of bacterial toxin-antitoxin [Neomoorella glycerini]|uniref:HicA toxin of bacterial toxin-antitoxin n=1 Tax=Neomoorella glycerini TaxID=55779 RepID=A0A6I5ZRB5_9FIRM|nr:type II toxin-antitoxin system HicA family toxin [Moorella glycerini]QGP92543.1 HicA toxin of bacterial toxin-antitoxin [Moorella glycerini]